MRRHLRHASSVWFLFRNKHRVVPSPLSRTRQGPTKAASFAMAQFLHGVLLEKGRARRKWSRPSPLFCGAVDREGQWLAKMRGTHSFCAFGGAAARCAFPAQAWLAHGLQQWRDGGHCIETTVQHDRCNCSADGCRRKYALWHCGRSLAAGPDGCCAAKTDNGCTGGATLSRTRLEKSHPTLGSVSHAEARAARGACRGAHKREAPPCRCR